MKQRTMMTSENREKVLQTLREGHSFTIAAAEAGMSRQTLYNWRKQDKEFDEECNIADAQGMKKSEKKLDEFAETDFNALKFKLERRKATRDEYAPALHNPALAIQNNYFNPLAQFAPIRDLLTLPDPVIGAEAIEGEVVGDIRALSDGSE